jgi:hypothetical protein
LKLVWSNRHRVRANGQSPAMTPTPSTRVDDA